MANTLTNLIPDAYAALDVVSRELVGFIPSVTRDARADAVAKGQTVRVPVTRANAAGANITPSMSIPSAADQTIDNEGIQITKFRAWPFSWTGEEQYAMDQGPGYLTLKQAQIAQAFRAAVNEIEADLGEAAALGASRATGTKGTIPFASTLGDSAQVRKILDDNGAPASGRSLVVSTACGANIRTLGNFTKVNEAGNSMTLRDGELLNIHGFSLKESAGVHTPAAAGTAASAKTDGNAHAKGATSITLKAAGTGTILAGDVLTIDGDPNKYIVTEKVEAVSGATVKIAAPGLQKAIPAAEKDVAVIAANPRNIGLSSNALVLATRLPALPEEGDMAIFREQITDPRSGLTFLLEVYGGHHMNLYRVAIGWGVKVIKPEHIAMLLE